MTCTGSAPAVADQYTNLASVEGSGPLGVIVRDEDPSHYFGGVPGIDLQKYTNGSDSDEPTGLFIPVDDEVTGTTSSRTRGPRRSPGSWSPMTRASR